MPAHSQMRDGEQALRQGGGSFGLLTSFLLVLSLFDWSVIAVRTHLLATHPWLSGAVALVLFLAPASALAAYLLAKPSSVSPASAIRLESELGHIVVRIAFAVGLLTLAAISAVLGSVGFDILLGAVVIGIGTVVCWLFLVHIILFPKPDSLRKSAAIVVEAGMLSVFLYAGDSSAAPWFFIYVLLVFSWGFRCGPRWSMFAGAVNAIGFALVVATTPVWRSNWPVAIGLMAELVLLPAYLVRAIDKLSAERRRAEIAASEAKGQLFAFMERELRGQMEETAGLVALIRETPLSREQVSMIDLIKSSADNTIDTLVNLITFAGFETMKLSGEASDFDLPRLLGEVAAATAPGAARKGLVVGCQIDPALPDVIRGHPAELRRILMNLMMNAVKTTQRGEVRLLASLEGDRSMVRFEVRDTGNGSASELRMAVVRKLTAITGGLVEVTNERDVGSCSAVTLPFTRIAQHLQHRQHHFYGANVGIYGPASIVAETFNANPAFNAIGVAFTPMGEFPDSSASAPEGYELLVFDGRQDPIGALATAARLGGMTMRAAPATLVIASSGMSKHLREIAAAAVDTILPWTEDREILVRAVARLLDRAAATTRAEASPASATEDATTKLAAAASRLRVLISEYQQDGQDGSGTYPTRRMP